MQTEPISKITNEKKDKALGSKCSTLSQGIINCASCFISNYKPGGFVPRGMNQLGLL